MFRLRGIVWLFLIIWVAQVFLVLAFSGDDDVILKAQGLMKKRDCQSAISALEEHIRRSGTRNFNIYLELGNAYFMCTNFSKAYEAYRKGFDQNPRSFALCQGVAQAARNMGRLKEAGGLFERCASLTESPSSESEMLYAAALSYADAGMADKVIELFSKAVRDPSRASSDFLKLHIKAAIDLRRWREARASVLILIDRNPLDPEVWSILAYICHKEGDLAGAASALEILKVIAPQKAQLYETQTEKLYESLGIWWRLKSEKEHGTGSAEGYDREIIGLIATGESEKALSLCDLAYQNTKNKNFLLQKARILMRLKRYGEASELLKGLVSKEPENLQALMLIVASYINMGELEKAEEVVSEGLNKCSGENSKNTCESLLNLQSALSFLKDSQNKTTGSGQEKPLYQSH